MALVAPKPFSHRIILTPLNFWQKFLSPAKPE